MVSWRIHSRYIGIEFKQIISQVLMDAGDIIISPNALRSHYKFWENQIDSINI